MFSTRMHFSNLSTVNNNLPIRRSKHQDPETEAGGNSSSFTKISKNKLTNLLRGSYDPIVRRSYNALEESCHDANQGDTQRKEDHVPEGSVRYLGLLTSGGQGTQQASLVVNLAGDSGSEYVGDARERLLGDVDLNSHNAHKGDHDCCRELCQRIIINVSGQKFETQLKTLHRYPDTLLGDPEKRKKFWDARRQEYFLDRHRPSFEAILNFYQSGGRLRRPVEVPEDIFFDELKFYQIGEEEIEKFKKQEGIPVEKPLILPKNKLKRNIWLLFEFPQSSIAARIVGILSIGVILLSIVTFCLETLPEFEGNQCINITEVSSEGDVIIVKEFAPNFDDPFFHIESGCVAWFTFELVVRFLSCPSKLKFVKNFMNIFDLLAILPFFIIVPVVTILQTCTHGEKSASLAYLRILRLLRVTRIFKLSKHSRGLQILGLTLKASMKELLMFSIFLAISVVLFAAMVFYAEFDNEKSMFTSIPDAFWWAIVTMTTIGYGDIVPIGLWGKLVGGVCVIAGVLTIALPVPIVVSNFNNFYRHEQNKGSSSSGLG